MKRIVIFLILTAFACVASTESGRRTQLSRSDFPANAKFLALTFDDGPNTTYTVQILDKLKDLGAKATFYVNPAKFNAQTLPVIKRMIAEGHDVCNHTWTHQSMGGSQNYMGPPITTKAGAREDLRKASQAIFDATGYWPFSFRAPFFEWGAFMFELDQELNMAFVDASIDPQDFNKQAAGGRQEIANGITRHMRLGDGGIILLHDCGGSRPETVASLDIFIPQLKAQGYEFVTVRELFMIQQTMPARFLGGQSNVWTRPNQQTPRVQSTETVAPLWEDYFEWPEAPNEWTPPNWLEGIVSIFRKIV